MPRSPEQVEHIKEERRRALLRAARFVFARKGVAATKISDVAAHAGISYGLVYHYFPEKDSLFAAVLEESIQRGETLVASARQQPGTPWDRLAYLCDQMNTQLKEEPEYLLVVVQAFTSDTTPRSVRDAFVRYHQYFFQHIVAMIEEGQRAGEVAPGAPDELARVILAITQGLAITWLVDPSAAIPSLEVVLRILKA